MANIDLKFKGLYSQESYIKVEFVDYNDEDSTNDIMIELFDAEGSKNSNFIFLDKSTAIKFAKTLRTEINKITE